MKLSDYKKVLDELTKLGYPVREMTATDTWLMWKAFKRNQGGQDGIQIQFNRESMLSSASSIYSKDGTRLFRKS